MFDIICQKYDLCRKNKVYNKKKIRNQLFHSFQSNPCNKFFHRKPSKKQITFIPFANQRTPLGKLITFNSTKPLTLSQQQLFQSLKSRVNLANQIIKNTSLNYSNPEVQLILKKNKQSMKLYKLKESMSQTFFVSNNIRKNSLITEFNQSKIFPFSISENQQRLIKNLKKRVFCLQSNRIFNINKRQFQSVSCKNDQRTQKRNKKEIDIRDLSKQKRIRMMIKSKLAEMQEKNKIFEQLQI